MQKPATVLLYSVGLFFASGLLAQPVSPSLNASDRAWLALKVPVQTAPLESTKGKPVDPAVLKSISDARAASFVAKADQAKDFYTQYPEHARAGEARLVEVHALVGANNHGNATIEGRLTSIIQTVRGDKSIPVSIRVQAVATVGFSREMQKSKTHEERLVGIEAVSRGLIYEFPEQPQGYESLLTVAATTGEEARARKIAGDLIDLPSPMRIKEGAKKLLAGLNLVGKSLEGELIGANVSGFETALQPGLPTIVYSWTMANRGSLALAAELKKRELPANFIGLNLDNDPKAAEAVAQQQGLVGTLIYDDRGHQGALAQRLGITSGSQVFLIDAQGVIRDVRGDRDLKNKLKQIGL